MSSPQPFSPAFLADLRAFHATVAGPLLLRFLADLRAIAATLPAPLTDADLAKLRTAFDQWRERTRWQLAAALAQLSPGDPLRCPVSLFRPLGLGRLETAHTRALAWLLSPVAQHGFGNVLLRALLIHLTSDTALLLAPGSTVNTEERIDTGRLDIFAYGDWRRSTGGPSKWALVLEAKIDAGEGEDQLDRYDDWLKRQVSAEPLRIFLTPDGRQPNSGGPGWRTLSFLDLVRIFRAASAPLQDAPGAAFLRFYLSGVLQDVCHWSLPLEANCFDPYSALRLLQTAVFVSEIANASAR
jgi:hypothetical protein